MTHYIYNQFGHARGFVNGKFIHNIHGHTIGQINGETHIYKLSGAYVGELDHDLKALEIYRRRTMHLLSNDLASTRFTSLGLTLFFSQRQLNEKSEIKALVKSLETISTKQNAMLRSVLWSK